MTSLTRFALPILAKAIAFNPATWEDYGLRTGGSYTSMGLAQDLTMFLP